MTATRKEIFSAKTLEQLKTLERKHGYKFGWANKVFAARSNPRKRHRKSSGEVCPPRQYKD